MTSRNTPRDDFDRLMSQWMDADARVREPEHLLKSVLERTRVTRRIPSWLLLERWMPVQLTMPLRAVPRLAPVLLLIALVLALIVAILVGRLRATTSGPLRVGSQRPRRLRLERPDSMSRNPTGPTRSR